MTAKKPILYIRPGASLKARLEEAAAENRRSLNAEVCIRLMRSFSEWHQDPVTQRRR